jgi:hypothetical protein
MGNGFIRMRWDEKGVDLGKWLESGWTSVRLYPPAPFLFYFSNVNNAKHRVYDGSKAKQRILLY